MLSLIVRAQTLGWRAGKRLRDEDGQTSSEYLIIAGIVVAVLLTVMLMFRQEILNAMQKIVANFKKAPM